MNERIRDLDLSYLEVSETTDEGVPIVVMIHGRGADAGDLVELAAEIGAGYRYLFPDAPKPFSPMPGYSFGLTWFEGLPPEKESFRASRTALLRWLEQVSARYGTPLSRFVIAGFSQGGVMSLDAGFRTSPPPAGIVVMSGAMHEADAPDFAAGPVPVCMVHGTGDEILPVQHARRARAVLEQARIDVDYSEYAMGHNVTLESIARVRAFIQRVLPLQSE